MPPYRQRIIIPLIYEGKSETAYLQKFNVYCREHGIPLAISHVCAQGGHFENISKAIKLLKQKGDFKSDAWCWLDHDLYAKNSRACMDKLQRAQASSKKFPQIKFNYQNFEDFLSLHLCPQQALAWSQIGEKHHHQSRPMVSNEYLKSFKELVPNYRKGQLPDDFDIAQAFTHLRQNIIDTELTQSSEMASFVLKLLDSHKG